MAHREILVSHGAVEYVGGTVTEKDGKDISTATFQLSLGSKENPSTWVNPTVSAQGPGGNSTRSLKLLVNSATAKGEWYCWARITDNPETTTVRFPILLIVR